MAESEAQSGLPLSLVMSLIGGVGLALSTFAALYIHSPAPNLAVEPGTPLVQAQLREPSVRFTYYLVSSAEGRSRLEATLAADAASGTRVPQMAYAVVAMDEAGDDYLARLAEVHYEAEILDLRR